MATRNVIAFIYFISLQTFHFSSTNKWLSVTDIMPMYIVYGWIQYEKRSQKIINLMYKEKRYILQKKTYTQIPLSELL